MKSEKISQISNQTIRKRSRLWVSFITVVFILLLIVGSILYNEYEEAPEILQTGWQFYSYPTTLEPVGTVFRIDPQGRRSIVTDLEVSSTTGSEAMGKVKQKMVTRGDVIARFLKISLGAEAKGGRQQSIEFEMEDTERAITSDHDVGKVLDSFFDIVRFRVDNRYFIIREARSAKVIHYKINDSILADLGGEAVIKGLANLDAGFQYESNKSYNLSQTFPERMRVMFLPEEIVPVSASLGSEMPEVEAVPVDEVLVWHN